MKKSSPLKGVTFSLLILFTLSSSFAQGLEIDSSNVIKKLDPINKLIGPTSDLEAVAISPTGNILAAGGWDKNIYIFSLELNNFGEILHTFKNHSSAILSLSFDKRGEYLAASSNDHTLTTWNIDSALQTGMQRQDLAINNVKYGPSIKYVYSSIKNGEIKVWDMMDPKRIRTINTKMKINSFAMSKDRKFVFTAGESNHVKKFNLKGIEIISLEGHTAFINDIALSTKGQLLASASDDKTIKIWDLVRSKEKLTLTGHTSKVNTVAFTSDDKYIISGDHSGEVIIWEIETGNIVKRIAGLGKSIRNLSISRYMDYIAVASYENSGEKNVVYYCATGLLNNALDMRRKANKRKEALRKEKEANEKTPEELREENIEDILNETQEQF